MDPDRWHRVEELYHAALALSAGERTGFLARTCPDDDVRREVESLLAQSFGSRLSIDVAAALPLIGRSLGSYQVQSLIGMGGMGEVYRARDTRLGRDVAIKILPQAFAADPERLVRFEREA